MDPTRDAIRTKAQAAGSDLSWFETLYAGAEGDPGQIPWAHRKPNRWLVSWLEREHPIARGRRALVVGCGLGDDAELLSRWGYTVTAFDLSPTAVAWARQRFPSTRVTYQSADLLNLPAGWQGGWDFVFEAYTLQALPNELRPQATKAVASLVKPGGRLLLVARGREADESVEGPPWPLTRDEVGALAADDGLRLESFEDLEDDSDEATPIRRFRASFVRDAT